MYDTLVFQDGKAFWAQRDRSLETRGQVANVRVIEGYLWFVNFTMRCFGCDCWLADCMDDLLNRYLRRYGLEYIRIERLG